MQIEKSQNVPIDIWHDGSLRVRGTNLPVDLLLNSHKNGVSPERIYDAFPGEYSLADIYLIIAYYLNHKDSFERYLVMRKKQKNNKFLLTR